MTRASRRGPLVGLCRLLADPRRRLLAAALLVAAAAAPGAAGAQDIARDFARRANDALLAGVVEQDALWAPASRTASQRLLDGRSASLFAWSNLRLEGIAHGPLPAAPSGASRATVEVRTRGTATWLPRAWGIATNFWTLQADEMSEANPVTGREQWALEEHNGLWRALERRTLGPLEVIEARLVVDVLPGQDALLVEGAYYVRAIVDSLRAVRMLVDRRASFYDFRVDGEPVAVIRGNELGSLGLAGFSPELESSFALPAPLTAGEEALVTFRLRCPLVHMVGKGFATSVPCREGPFRERLWLPILAPSSATAPDASHIDLTLRWSAKKFDRAAVSAPDVKDAPIIAGDETSTAHVDWTGGLRDVDFLLLAPGAQPDALGLDVHWTGDAPGTLARLERTDALPERLLKSGRRERAAMVRPVLEASYSATHDFGSELQELLPLDDDVLNELTDESTTDAEQGADDRSAN